MLSYTRTLRYAANLSPASWLTSGPPRQRPLPGSGHSVDTKKRTSMFRSQEWVSGTHPTQCPLTSSPPKVGQSEEGLVEPLLPGTHSCGCWELSLVNLLVRPRSHSPWRAEVGKAAKVVGERVRGYAHRPAPPQLRMEEWVQGVEGKEGALPTLPTRTVGWEGKRQCQGEPGKGKRWRKGPVRWSPQPPPGNPLSCPIHLGLPSPGFRAWMTLKLVSQ